jgi:outer membrane usher protein
VDVANAPTRLNPTGRDISLVAPLREGEFILGEVDFILGADDSIRVNAQRLTDILQPILNDRAHGELASRLRGLNFVTGDQLASFGFPIRYSPETIGLAIDVPAAARTTRTIQLRRSSDELLGTIDDPASVSGYLNLRSFTEYQWQGIDQGFRGPTFLLDSAIRYRGFVLENEGTLRFNDEGGEAFTREGTRIVYDDRKRLARWTLGDLRPISRGFSGAPQLAGLSLFRVYSVLQPLRNVQPNSDRTFTLTRPSTVEAIINGSPVRRIRLDPGTYNVRDFPFVQGSNDVRLVIEDDAGGRETIDFSLYFDRTLLARGLTEFGIFAGVRAPFSGSGRDYQFDEPGASGFFRKGFRDDLTAGGNFELGRRGLVIGGEAVIGTRFGLLGGDAAGSYVKDIGAGYAFNLSLIRSGGGRVGNGRSFAFSLEHRSKNFASPSQRIAENRYAWDFSGSVSQSLGDRHFLSLTGQYSIGRGTFDNEKSLRAIYGWQISRRMGLTVEGFYDDRSQFDDNMGVRARLVFRVSPRSSATAEYDTRVNRGRLGYQTSRGDGVGSWDVDAEVDVGKDDVAFDGGFNYTANRAEFAVNHTSVFDVDGTNVESQRTSLQLGTALVFADGNFAFSRPIFDSFVMVKPHKTLKGAPVFVEPRGNTYTAKSGLFGPAVEPDLPAYIERLITYDVPNAPIGYDLGQGNVRVQPPYRSGYLVTAGSDYSVTTIGTFLGPNGKPVSLLAGRAVEIIPGRAAELSSADRSPLQVFTNRAGRFGVSGMRPGRWRIDMPTEPPSFVIIDIPEGERGVYRLGPIQLEVAQ